MKNRGRNNKSKRISTYEIYDQDDSYAESISQHAGTLFSTTTRKNNAEQKVFVTPANNDQAADKLLESILFRAAEKNLQLMQDQADNAAKLARDANISYESLIKPAVDNTGNALAEIETKVNTNIQSNKELMKKLTAYKGGAAAHVKSALEALAGINKEDFEEIDFKKISSLINTLQQLTFKLKHETVTKTKFFQKTEQTKAQQLHDVLAPVVKALAENQKLINRYKETIRNYKNVYLDPFKKTSETVQGNLKRAESEFLEIYNEHRNNGGELKLEAPAALELVHKNKAVPPEPEAPKPRR